LAFFSFLDFTKKVNCWCVIVLFPWFFLSFLDLLKRLKISLVLSFLVLS
jgi:hypothetical protein